MATKRKKQYTIKDYIENTPYAHIRLYVQLKLTTEDEVFKSIADDMVLNFDLGKVRYQISMGDLKQKCREESEKYHDNINDKTV